MNRSHCHHASLLARSTVCLAALLIAGSAFAQDFPRRKAGLWETTMNSMQMQGQKVTAQHCIDAKTDAEMFKRGMENKEANCSQQTFKRTAAGMEFDSVCKQGDSTTTTHGVVTGDFNSQYTMDMKMHRTPALNGKSDFQMTSTARYLGACSADMKPGDMKVNGMLINANGMPAGLTPQQAEQMKKMMEQMQKQQK
ncbi:DUF3617 family protein [Uliginosibacterium sp. H3]|uniref:DUF3617 family protein n=1 Tax=Uliginosibacterium silvisoli TaxID=3114758 RepID=A0ABU6JXV2_9RHOO|nr:DUF3617 family protein [Uliginosibacterium sp. H3]